MLSRKLQKQKALGLIKTPDLAEAEKYKL